MGSQGILMVFLGNFYVATQYFTVGKVKSNVTYKFIRDTLQVQFTTSINKQTGTTKTLAVKNFGTIKGSVFTAIYLLYCIMFKFVQPPDVCCSIPNVKSKVKYALSLCS